MSPEPVAGPAAGSFLLHGALAGGLVLYGVLGGFFNHNVWGNAGAGGAIQVSLVSSALPLPADRPVNDNVLTTNSPSAAPAAPAPKAKEAVDEKAIAISGKQAKAQKETAPKTPKNQPQPKQENVAQFGEQAGMSIPRATAAQTAASSGPVSIANSDFGSRFGWYVDGMNRKMATGCGGSCWYRPGAESHIPKGARVYLAFTIHRDGSPTDVLIGRSSGSATLDISCQRAVQRVDSFGNLPQDYNQSTLKVSYYCEY